MQGNFFIKINLLLSNICLMGLLGCSFPDKGTLGDLQRDLQDRDKIIDVYRAIEGVYEGFIFLSNQNRKIEATLYLTYREVPVGSDNDGQIKYRPRLFAKLSRPELLVSDVKMEGVFEAASRDITLSALPGETEALFLRTILEDHGRIRGNLRLGSQIYGYIDVKLHTKTLPNDLDVDSEILRKKIKEVLQTLAGDYDAWVDEIQNLSPHVNVEPFKLEMFSMRISEYNNKLPELFIFYRRSPYFLVGQTKVIYKPHVIPHEIVFNMPKGGVAQETFEFTGYLNFIDGKPMITGQIIYPTFRGKLRAIKK